MANQRVPFFEDYGEDWLELLKVLLKRTRTPLLDAYVERAARALRHEIALDTVLSKQEDWEFTTLQELCEHIERQPSAWPLAIKATVTCLSQLGLYLDDYQRCEGEPAQQAFGVGIGSLAASVAASARSANQALELSVPTIALSFRIGALAQQRLGNCLGSHDSTNAPAWGSMFVQWSETDADARVTNFNSRMALRVHSRCSIAASMPAGSVICGPMEMIESLREHYKLTAKVVSSLPLSLLLDADMDQVIDSLEESSETLRQAAYDSLHPDLNLVYTSLASEVTLLTFGSSLLAQYLCKMLQTESRKVHLEDVTSSSEDSTTSSPQKSPIAIVGMSGRFPGADDVEALWELLQAGRDVHRNVPADRFDYRTHTDPTGKRNNTSKSPYGCFIEEPGLFDSKFFNMSPKEALQTDPAQRLMILTAYEALEMAGFVPNQTPSSRRNRVATFYGQASDDWREVNSSQNIDTFFIPGGIRAFGPGRINYHLKLSGPSYSVDTACSSSFAAIHAACNSLWAGDCDTALSGGANVMTNSDIFAGLSSGHFLSQTGPCKTFDSGADGYCRADGVASVVLKRLEDAERDCDNILGLIVGVGTNHSANAVSITHPHAPTQATLYRSLLSNNGVHPHDVGYVEMHGTGTAAGDYNEMLSVSDVFAPRHMLRREHALYVSSIKANVGHAEAAAGITSLVKVLLMLRHKAIPPHVGVKGEVNPAFPPDLETRNVHIPFTGAQWPTGKNPRMAFLNNFSAAGGNTALILQEYKSPGRVRRPHPRSPFVLTVSARTPNSLQGNLDRLADFISATPSIELADLAYTLTARRKVHTFRKSFVVTSLPQAETMLRSSAKATLSPPPSRLPHVVFTFTGQGSLYAPLAQNLFRTARSFRDDILEYDQMAQAEGFPSFLPLIDGSSGDAFTLPLVIQQVGQVCVQLALARLWMSWGIQPEAVVGHSLGEYAALAVAGVFSIMDMIFLVGTRAQLLEQQCPAQSSGMLAVSANADVLASSLSGSTVEIACKNAPGMTVLGGLHEDLQSCAESFRANGHRCTKLPVAYAYHTAQVEPIMEAFATEAQRVRYGTPTIPVMSPLLGRTVDTDVFGPEYLCRHTRETVDFLGTISALDAEWTDRTVWLEIGPHPTCTRFVEKTLGPKAVAHSLQQDIDPWRTLSQSIGTFYDKGFAINWDAFHRGFEDHHQLLDLPAYAWDLKRFWIDYTNDWCLTKGDVSLVEAAPEVSAPPLSMSVHRVVEESIETDKASLVAETDFTEPILQKLASGHRVNGVSLCPSSLYADMAFTVARYLHQRVWPDSPLPAFDVSTMSVDKPFIISERSNVLFRIHASITPAGVTIQLATVDRNDTTKQTSHATCEVRFGALDTWSGKWNRQSYLIRERTAALERAACEGRAHRIQRSLVYRLFSSFVDYDAAFQGIEEVILDGPQFEATARVVLKPLEEGANFDVPATWIDSLCHLSGVILNASDAVDPSEWVFISHGWKSLRIGTELRAGDTYRTYVRMQETKKGIMEGDVWILDGDTPVGLAKGLKFQRIARKTIDALLPNPNAAPVRKVKPTPVSHEPQAPVSQPTMTAAPAAKTTPSSTDPVAEVLGVIAEECGAELSELEDGCDFASLGIDSLLSLQIAAKLRESHDIDLNSSMFLDSENIGEFKAQLANLLGTATNVPPPPKLDTRAVGLPLRTATIDSSATPFTSSDAGDATFDQVLYTHQSSSASMTSLSSEESDRTPPTRSAQATSFLLSGNPQIASKTLFLFPDGSGSATSYATLPRFPTDTCVYALNCPFMTNPTAWGAGVPTVMKHYLDEIRRRQPIGPYNLGGWSAGGILAYEAAYQLQAAGDAVDRLILIDSPCPIRLPQMPVKMFRFLDSIGLLGARGAKSTPDWLIPHFEATVRNLDTYHPQPFARGKEPATTTIWARKGVLSATGGRQPTRQPDDPAVMNWLLDDRVDFGSNGWDALIPGSSIRPEIMDGHHFSMTNTNVNELGRLMVSAMS